MTVRVLGVLLALLAGSVGFAEAARADCTLNGVRYVEGTVYGNLVCVGNQWVRKR